MKGMDPSGEFAWLTNNQTANETVGIKMNSTF